MNLLLAGPGIGGGVILKHLDITEASYSAFSLYLFLLFFFFFLWLLSNIAWM